MGAWRGGGVAFSTPADGSVVLPRPARGVGLGTECSGPPPDPPVLQPTHQTVADSVKSLAGARLLDAASQAVAHIPEVGGDRQGEVRCVRARQPKRRVRGRCKVNMELPDLEGVA